jgi:hypothetical protein
MGQTSDSVLSRNRKKWLQKQKGVHIKVNLSESPLWNSSNHRKEIDAEDALSESNVGIEKERGTNTDPVTEVSIKWSDHIYISKEIAIQTTKNIVNYEKKKKTRKRLEK